MTVRLDLPPDVERRLRAEVAAGRHSTLEEAIIEKLSRSDDVDLLSIMPADQLRRDLDDAWDNRQGAVSGEEFFNRIASRMTQERD